MTLAAAVNVGIYILAAALGVIGALFGVVRGLSRQTIRFITIIASAVISFFICVAITPAIIGIFEGMTMQDLLSKVTGIIPIEQPIQNFICSFDSAFLGHAVSLPMGLIIIPIAFVLIFMIVSLLLLIVHVILCGAFAFTKKRNNIVTRLLGAALGFVQGALVAMVLLLPISGLMGTVDNALDIANTKYPESVNVVSLTKSYDSIMGETDGNFILKLADGVNDVVYSRFTTVKMADTEVDLRDSVVASVDILAALGELSESNLYNLNPAEQLAFSYMIDDICDDKYLSIFVSDFLRGISTALDQGTLVCTYKEPVKEFVLDIIKVLSTTDSTKIDGDLTTVQNVYFLLSDGSSLISMSTSPQRMYKNLSKLTPSGTTLFSQLSHEFSKNDRMEHLAAKLTKLSMSLLLTGRGQDAASTDKALSDVNDVLDNIASLDKSGFATDEEYKASVNASVDEALKSHGIEMPAEKINELSDFVLEQIGDKTSVSEADVSEFMIEYYDIYAEYMAKKQLEIE